MMTNHKMELALTQTFQRSLTKLDNVSQAHVNEALLKVQKGYESIHIHSLEGVPFVSLGINRNAMRIICRRDGDLLIMLHVGLHDPAYEWAKRHKIIKIGKFVRLMRTKIEDEAIDTTAEETTTGPLSAVPLKTFRHFGVESAAATVLRWVPDETSLLELLAFFREPLGEAILNLATDLDNLQQIVADYHDALKKIKEGASLHVDLKEAVKDPVNAENFVVSSSEAFLNSYLSGDFARWRVFLHPSQKRLTELNSKGAYKVTGGPGTGKTVVALHRARFLAEKVFKNDPRPILLTTFSRVLTYELQHSMKLLCQDKPELMSRFEIKTLTRVAQDLLSCADSPHTFLNKDVVSDCWRHALKSEVLGLDDKFYASEREHVIARQGAWTENQYFRASRAGRKGRLDRVKKRKVWEVIKAFEERLKHFGGGDTHTLAREATMLVASGQTTQPYAAVICDELQDVSASDLRLLAALVRDKESGKTWANGLFVVGDSYQSLYRQPVALSRCGIAITGRSSILKRNYRTTEGIRRAAIQAVKGVTFTQQEDELQGDLFSGYVSSRQGPAPEEFQFKTPEAEADWIADRAKEQGQLLILTRTNNWRNKLAEKLRTRGLRPKVLEGQDKLNSDDLLVLSTLHRSKGLEAPRVIIAGSHQLPQPWHGKGDSGEKSVWERQEKCLLYVGMTRARDWCAKTSVKR